MRREGRKPGSRNRKNLSVEAGVETMSKRERLLAGVDVLERPRARSGYFDKVGPLGPPRPLLMGMGPGSSAAGDPS